MWSSAIWRRRPLRSQNARESPIWASAARPPENSTAVSVVPLPGSVAAKAPGDGEQPHIAARSFPVHGPATVAQHSLLLPTRRLPSAAGQIRKTCGIPAYLRVVIESDRTQASRTMNAEPAQVTADRVG